MTYDPNNVFAKIIRSQLPCVKIYEDEDILSFYDAYPQAKIHALVIPKEPFKDYDDFMTHASLELIAKYFQTIQHVISLLKLDSYRLVTNKGKQSGQSVFHFHTHILCDNNITNLI